MLPWPARRPQLAAMSYSPQTGYVYIPALEAGFGYAPVETKGFERRPGLWNLGVDPVVSAIPETPRARPSAPPPLVVWSPGTRSHASRPGWSSTRCRGTASSLSIRRRPAVAQWPGPAWLGGPTEPAGLRRPDRHHRRAGELRGGDGEQYVTVNAGWGGAAPTVVGEIVLDAAKGKFNRVLTFKLGGKAERPAVKTAARPLDPPPATAPRRSLLTASVSSDLLHDGPRRHRRVGRHGAGLALFGNASRRERLEVDRARRLDGWKMHASSVPSD